MTDVQHRQVLEIIVVIGVWMIVFDLVAGPVIDSVLTGHQPSAFEDDDSSTYAELPDSVRGWAAIVTGAPVLAGYLVLRARLSGDSATD